MKFHEREAKWQKTWKDQRAFEGNPDARKKFFCTFPYPYVNGLPHIGHTFSIMRTEVFARYKRLQGYNVLFPQGWHATGTPIAAAAQRIAEKDPKQMKILTDLDVPEADLDKFVEPEHWIEYFVPKYKQDITEIGMSVDWRREFHTTSLNPHYDAFIRWQFEVLHEKGYVKKGKHPVVWCPKMETVVGDHDRIKGEGETPQEFLLVKHKLDDGKFLVSATLRPDTILGLTNLYVNPEGDYVEATVNGETWIIGAPAAQRLEEQGHEVSVGKTVKGKKFIGQKTTEFGDRKVPVLPASFLDPKVGTGLVHSVPSESADDLIALQDLQKDEEFCKKYELDPVMIAEIQPIEILDTPDIGGNPAQFYLDKYEIKSQDERKKLDQIRKELYKMSFYSAKFGDIYKGVFERDVSGMPIQEGMQYVKEQLIEAGWAELYYELTGPVISRANVPSIVRVVSDQWFLSYGDLDWKEQVHGAVEQLNLYPEKTRAQFSYVVDWLQNWACAREIGLGTRLPWDNKWVIESLSDSTIYMAYYTIAHKIKDIPAEQLTRAFFDYVMLGKGDKPNTPVDADELRKEFLYWYPMDFRNSGKDLVQNHLTFMLFNHAAIFPKELWPKGIGVNGWVTVDGQKMSKSLGNVIPVRRLLKEFGADATRITILNGGEGLDDPNWDSNFAKSMGGKLNHILQMAEQEMSDSPGELDAWLESKTNSLVKKTTDAMEQTLFRTAIQAGFFEYGKVLRDYVSKSTPNKTLFKKKLSDYLVIISPFVPHIAEEAWELLGNEGLVSLASWPEVDESKIDEKVEQEVTYFADVTANIVRVAKEKPQKIALFLADDWKYTFVAQFRRLFETIKNPKEIGEQIAAKVDAEAGEVMKLSFATMKNMKLLPHVDWKPEEEKALLERSLSKLSERFGCDVVIGTDSSSPKAKSGLPGRPAIELM